MQNWEYKAVKEDSHKQGEIALNKAGEEGWEAFAVTNWAWRADSPIIWLKRPKQP